MKIGGFQLPKLNLNNLIGSIGGQVLKGVTDTLKNVVGDFFKSGFEAAKKSLLENIAKQLGIPMPPQALGSKDPGMPANGNTGVAGGTATGGATATGGTGATGSTGSADGSLGMSSPTGGDDPKALIAHEMGPEMVAEYDKMSPAQKEQLVTQAKMQRASRVGQTMTSLLAAIHEMSKAIIQNFRA